MATGDIFKMHFFNKNVWILIKISLKFVPRGPVDNMAALVQIMTWWQRGNKSLFEPMMAKLIDAYMHHLSKKD